MSTFIYILIDPIYDQVRYVGKSDNPEYRLINHCKDKRLTKNKSWILSLKKKGLTPALQIIDEVSKNEWEFWEQYWIAQMRAWGFSLNNMTTGGNSNYERKISSSGKRIGGSKKGRKLSEETRNKMRLSRMGNKNPRFGKPHKKESLEKMANIKIGNKYRLGITREMKP